MDNYRKSTPLDDESDESQLVTRSSESSLKTITQETFTKEEAAAKEALAVHTYLSEPKGSSVLANETPAEPDDYPTLARIMPHLDPIAKNIIEYLNSRHGQSLDQYYMAQTNKDERSSPAMFDFTSKLVTEYLEGGNDPLFSHPGYYMAHFCGVLTGRVIELADDIMAKNYSKKREMGAQMSDALGKPESQ